MSDDRHGVIPRSAADVPTPKVVALSTPKSVARGEVVAILEEALANARVGRIEAIGLAMVEPNGGTATVTSSSEPLAALLGATAILHYRLLARNVGAGPGRPWFGPVEPDDAS